MENVSDKTDKYSSTTHLNECIYFLQKCLLYAQSHLCDVGASANCGWRKNQVQSDQHHSKSFRSI